MIGSEWPSVVRALASLRPFRKFYLVSGEKEWFVEGPNEIWVPEEADFAFYGSDGTTDIVNLSMVTHVRIDDDFGIVEAKQMWQ